ncbi:MAG: ArsR/SmtB family transcription factor [Gemmatimonadaceae bacterium]
MPSRLSLESSVTVQVTPRFDFFYALRALDEGSEIFEDWRKTTERMLPREFSRIARRVAPRPMMWPLLADSLRDTPSVATFDELIETVRSLDDKDFQRAVLSGVFRDPTVVDGLISKRRTLRETVESETKTSLALLRILGLQPFRSTSAVAEAFTRIISNPAEYRSDVGSAIEMFWESTFAETWNNLETQMQRRASAMHESLARRSLPVYATDMKLPVTFDDRAGVIATTKGVHLFSYGEIKQIHVMPSAFNDARFWGAYKDRSGVVQLYFPVFDPHLLRRANSHGVKPTAPDTAGPVDPALVFRALGDTTRYAMACILAKSPRTSIELAKDFGVSKATISHHVSMLRSAGLLRETHTDKGIALTLDRRALEDLSSNSARAMFSSANKPVVRRSRRDTIQRKPAGKNE